MLKAAELHGATHQAVMEFQVIAQPPLLLWIELETALAADKDFAPEPLVRDRR